MNEVLSAEELAELVNDWCQKHRVEPASGQAGEWMTVRNIRYYRTLGLLDAPTVNGHHGFGEKHRLQLVAIRVLQAQGLPLQRIQELLFGRTLLDLERIEKEGVAELGDKTWPTFRPSGNESWCVTPLNEEFMLVSRRGRAIGAEVRQRLMNALEVQEFPRKGRNSKSRKTEPSGNGRSSK